MDNWTCQIAKDPQRIRAHKLAEGSANVPDPDGTDVTIIVISFNTRDMTVECLRSIGEQTHNITYEIIVVDNNSSDGSADTIRAGFPSLKLIASDDNLGFARANNF